MSDPQVYFDVISSAFFAGKPSAYRQHFLHLEAAHAAIQGVMYYDEEGCPLTDYSRHELIELAMARVNQIRAEQRRLFGENHPLVETEGFFD